jgi:hypothetical protein
VVKNIEYLTFHLWKASIERLEDIKNREKNEKQNMSHCSVGTLLK